VRHQRPLCRKIARKKQDGRKDPLLDFDRRDTLALLGLGGFDNSNPCIGCAQLRAVDGVRRAGVDRAGCDTSDCAISLGAGDADRCAPRRRGNSDLTARATRLLDEADGAGLCLLDEGAVAGGEVNIKASDERFASVGRRSARSSMSEAAVCSPLVKSGRLDAAARLRSPTSRDWRSRPSVMACGTSTSPCRGGGCRPRVVAGSVCRLRLRRWLRIWSASSLRQSLDVRCCGCPRATTSWLWRCACWPPDQCDQREETGHGNWFQPAIEPQDRPNLRVGGAPSTPDRNASCRRRASGTVEHINAKVVAAQAAGQPVISVDTNFHQTGSLSTLHATPSGRSRDSAERAVTGRLTAHHTPKRQPSLVGSKRIALVWAPPRFNPPS
jgi:hypothetical protein